MNKTSGKDERRDLHNGVQFNVQKSTVTATAARMQLLSLPCSAQEDLSRRDELVHGDLEVRGCGAAADAARDIVVRAVARAVPAVVVARIRDGHAAKVRADADDDEPAGEQQRRRRGRDTRAPAGPPTGYSPLGVNCAHCVGLRVSEHREVRRLGLFNLSVRVGRGMRWG